MPDHIEGRFKRHPRGFGFVRTATPFAEGDLYIAAEDSGGAMTGDVVQAEVRHGRRGDRSSGRVVEVVQRRAPIYGNHDQTRLGLDRRT